MGVAGFPPNLPPQPVLQLPLGVSSYPLDLHQRFLPALTAYITL
jgi:hypothetical protein